MKKFIIQILGLALVIVIIFMVAFNDTVKTNFLSLLIPTNQVISKKQIRIVDGQSSQVKAELAIDLADTKEKRGKGLGGRESLATNEGMLFVFPSSAMQVFWMKGMKFPLDFIWINGNQVVDILKNVPAPQAGQTDASLPKYGSEKPVDKVLEVQAGFIDQHNIAPGDLLEDITNP